MVTHNLRHALESGNIFFIIHWSKISTYIQQEEKLDTNHILGLLEKANGEGVLSDRTLFG